MPVCLLNVVVLTFADHGAITGYQDAV